MLSSLKSLYHQKFKWIIALLFVLLILTFYSNSRQDFKFEFQKNPIKNEKQPSISIIKENTQDTIKSDQDEKSKFKIPESEEIKPSKITNIKDKEVDSKSCDPIDRNFKQYSVDFNGIIYPRYLLRNQNYSNNFDCFNKKHENKVILAWNSFYGSKNFGYGIGKNQPFINNNCPVTNCELTNDKSRLNEADYAMVLVSDSFDKLPVERASKTRWVWMLIESPYYQRTYGHLNGLFNYTSDFLYESEFGSNYASQMRFLWAKNTTFNEKHNYHAGKTGFLTALISNCGASNNRLKYVHKLGTYIDVQIYGRCGTTCPSGNCREYVGAKYKFYFSFENSFCKDYITEKFFLMLKYDIVPVVFGSGNYSRFIPKSAYIDAYDYESPKHLADYLKYLDKNVTAYNEYFQWKKHVNFLDKMVNFGMVCDMCIQLHLEKYYGIKQQVIHDFTKYFSKSEQCKNSRDISQLRNL